MKKLFFFLSLFSCIYFFANAQSFLNISSGISYDINNASKSFYHVPVSVQWKPSSNPRGAFFFELDEDIPFTTKSTGNAYTLNPFLPQEVTLQESIRGYIFAASIGFRVYLHKDKKLNSLYLNILPFGISTQSFKVNYKNYDDKNYEILNPDVNLKRTGVVVSMSAVYNFHNNLMLMLHLQSPLIADKGDYPLSYRFIAPLQFSIGYNFYYNKRK
ncbi:MAG TPA: hypothetical protein VK787_09455 [Puia sp.]|jgi:hypothetical protein|nr:hypothetical protein [Puia sp.]